MIKPDPSLVCGCGYFEFKGGMAMSVDSLNRLILLEVGERLSNLEKVQNTCEHSNLCAGAPFFPTEHKEYFNFCMQFRTFVPKHAVVSFSMRGV